MQRQTAVTAYLKSKPLLLFVFALADFWAVPGNCESWSVPVTQGDAEWSTGSRGGGGGGRGPGSDWLNVDLPPVISPGATSLACPSHSLALVKPSAPQRTYLGLSIFISAWTVQDKNKVTKINIDIFQRVNSSRKDWNNKNNSNKYFFNAWIALVKKLLIFYAMICNDFFLNICMKHILFRYNLLFYSCTLLLQFPPCSW